MMQKTTATTISAYIKTFPNIIQSKLQEIYQTIEKAAPHATQTIKYSMPTFVWNKNIIHFAWCQKHIGFYPGPAAVLHFHKELVSYKTSKWAIQFPLDKPLPLELIAQITAYSVIQDAIKAKSKKQSKPLRHLLDITIYDINHRKHIYLCNIRQSPKYMDTATTYHTTKSCIRWSILSKSDKRSTSLRQIFLYYGSQTWKFQFWFFRNLHTGRTYEIHRIYHGRR